MGYRMKKTIIVKPKSKQRLKKVEVSYIMLEKLEMAVIY